MPENWIATTGHADASAWCCCARCKILEGVKLMLKLEMMLCVMMRCRWSSPVAHQSSLSVSAWSHHASGVDNAASPDRQTPLNGIISPSERGWSLCKNNWKEPRSILMSADRVAHIDGQLIIIVSNTHALPAEYKCLVIKLSNPFTNVCWVSF